MSTSITFDSRFRMPGNAPLMSAPIFSPSVATSAVGQFPGQRVGKVRGTGAWYDDVLAAVTPALTGAVQLGQKALENLVVKGQRKLGVEDSGQVFVDPTTGKAYPIVTQNGSIYLRNEFGNLVPYSNKTGYVTTQADILGTVKTYAPWVIGGLALVAVVYFTTRRRR